MATTMIRRMPSSAVGMGVIVVVRRVFVATVIR